MHMAHNTHTWKLLEVSSLFFPFVAHVFPILEIIFIHMSFKLKENCTSGSCKLYLCLHLANCSHLYLATAFLANYNYFSCKLSSCKLLTIFFFFPNYHLANCYLANCNFFFCKLSSCKLLSYFFLFNIGPCNTVSLLVVWR